MIPNDTETELLLDRARQGDESAVERLLSLHRGRLRRMIAVRLDGRLAPRLDPSDVLQEAAMEAIRRLPGYLRQPPCGFYPWLRQIAWERLVDLHRRHVHTQRRSVRREQPEELPDSRASLDPLVDWFQQTQTSPSQGAIREEVRRRVRAALTKLTEADREVLVLRHLEQLSMAETAEVLGVTLAAAQSRYRRALERLHGQLGGKGEEE